MSRESPQDHKIDWMLRLGPSPAAAADEPLSGDELPARVDGGLIPQLHALYADRARLHDALGTADAEAIVAMVRSLEAQLVDLYGARRRAFLAAAPLATAERDASEVPTDAEAGDDGQA